MKSSYRLFRHGKYFYSQDSRTGQQKSLRTGDRTEAERLLAAKNEAANKSELSLAVGHVYLAAIDPEMLTRTWASAMQFIAQRGGASIIWTGIEPGEFTSIIYVLAPLDLEDGGVAVHVTNAAQISFS